MTSRQRRGSIRLAAALLGLWFSGVAATATIYALQLDHARGMYAVSNRIATEGLTRPLDEIDRSIISDGDGFHEAMERARYGIILDLVIGIAGPLTMAVLIALGYWVRRGFRPQGISS